MPSVQSWPSLGQVDPLRLTEARLQAHHALQVVVSLGVSFLPPAADDSHTNLEWLDAQHALAGRPLPASRPFRSALRLADLTLLTLDGEGGRQSAFALPGQTIDAAYAWLMAECDRAGLMGAALTAAKHYTIPPHPVAGGMPFPVPDPRASRELEHYYSGADLVLRALARKTPAAAEVRCWPHHFDLATLISLPGERTIGVGLSPGDESYPEPYYYVTPWPYPEPPLPPLTLGAWHRDHWVGAVLTGSDIGSFPPGEQQTRVAGFLDQAVAHCRTLLGA